MLAVQKEGGKKCKRIYFSFCKNKEGADQSSLLRFRASCVSSQSDQNFHLSCLNRISSSMSDVSRVRLVMLVLV